MDKSREQEELYKVAKPLVEFIKAHYDIHTKVVVETDYIEVLSGISGISTKDFETKKR